MTDFIPAIDAALGRPALFCAILGIVLLLLANVQIRRGRILKGSIQSLVASIFLAFSILLLLLSTNLYTYQRLTLEQVVANIQFWQSGPQQFLAVITIPHRESEQSFILYGDDWQLDARILKWTAPAVLAGLNSRYRLERLSGRYRNVVQERSDQRSVFELSEEPGLAIWPILSRLMCCIDWIDTYYGNSTYLPMADQSSYQIILTQSGLIARPDNEQAVRAMRKW